MDKVWDWEWAVREFELFDCKSRESARGQKLEGSKGEQ